MDTKQNECSCKKKELSNKDTIKFLLIGIFVVFLLWFVVQVFMTNPDKGNICILEYPEFVKWNCTDVRETEDGSKIIVDNQAFLHYDRFQEQYDCFPQEEKGSYLIFEKCERCEGRCIGKVSYS